MSTLRWSYLLLLTGLVGSLIVYSLLDPAAQEGPRSFTLNLATEIMGILLTVLLIDSVIRGREERERKRYRSVPLQRLHQPLSNHLDLLCSMYKAAVREKPNYTSWCLEDLLTEDYKNQLSHLDLLKPGPSVRIIQDFPPQREPIPWFQHLHEQGKGFRENLERVVEKYAMQLDSETAGLIENLIHSPFMYRIVDHGPSIARSYQSFANWQGATHAPLTILSLPGDTSVLEHTRAFVQLVCICNEIEPEDRKIRISESTAWWDNVSPSVGSARAPVNYHDPVTGETITEE